MDAAGRLCGQGNVQDHNGLIGNGSVHERKAATIGPKTMLEVLPVPEGVHSFIGTDLLQKVTGRLPSDLADIQQLRSKPLAQDLLQVVAHLHEKVGRGS